MFQIKICGIRTVAEALAAVEAGADAIGLNFYPQSVRYVGDAASAIASAVGDRVLKVGVFVNAPAEEVIRLADELPLDVIQLHGDEPAKLLREFNPRRILKAFRIGPEGLAPLRSWFDDAMRGSLFPHGVLLDAHRAGQYGGTGDVGDWSSAASYARTPSLPPLVLAGGLTPANVAEAIQNVRPRGVDTAGGVESEPGVKHRGLMEAFVRAAREAFAKAENH